MKKLTLILLTGLILQACENAPVRREEMISEHPEWDKEMVEVIKAGYLVKGMSATGFANKHHTVNPFNFRFHLSIPTQ